MRLPRRNVIYQKAGKGVNSDPRLVLEHIADQGYPFVKGEQGVFLGVAGNRYDDLVKDLQTPLDNVQVAIGYRIE